MNCKVLILLSLFSFISAFNEEIAEKSNCPNHWTDATFVEMGCLLFLTNQTMTFYEADKFCQDSHPGMHTENINFSLKYFV